ncbi:MAG: copper homeostasis protein CutC [Muribaculum sp.]|nr:copper homeostasis protein CutC [Muribaculum sp.]
MIEICAQDIEGVGNAIKGGADRIELCSALEVGGLTPSVGLVGRSVWKCSRLLNPVPLHVLIRPRSGDFFYTDREIEVMTEDAVYAVQAGADGLVFGCLSPDGDVDDYACSKIIDTVRREITRPVHLTFHRAFDFCRDADRALKNIASLGFNTILTSGQKPTALLGADMIRHLKEIAPDHLTIMAGGGVTPDNIAAIKESTGVNWFHASAKRRIESKMEFRRNDVNTAQFGNDDYSSLTVDIDTVRKLKENSKQ